MIYTTIYIGQRLRERDSQGAVGPDKLRSKLHFILWLGPRTVSSSPSPAVLMYKMGGTMPKALVEKAQASGPGSISSKAAAARSKHSLRPFKFLCGYGALSPLRSLETRKARDKENPRGQAPGRVAVS